MIEIVVDNFAGGGGASHGIEKALGRPIDYAINHNREAIAMHKANHPFTEHLTEDVWNVDPLALLNGRRVGLGWFSPDCTFHSKARGGKPFRDRNTARRIRGLAWVVVKRAKLPNHQRPRVILLENVEEFAKWGPLLEDGTPCPVRKGFTFRRWWRQLENLGYKIEMRELVACDYGAPTSRKRLFVVARCDSQPIHWPARMFGPGLTPFRTAADCVDWDLPIPSIFLTKREAAIWAEIHGWKKPPKRPLEESTLRRLARGTFRYVIDNPRPFIVPLTHQGWDRVHSIDEPFRTLTGAHRGEMALAVPFLTEHANASHQRNFPANEPMRTLCAQVKGGHFALVSAFLARHYGGHENDGASASLPFHTITTQDHHALVTAHIQRDFGQSIGQRIDSPIGCITPDGGGKATLVTAFLHKYYGTEQKPDIQQPLPVVTTKDRFGLVTVEGGRYGIFDIGMRMFRSRELFRAQGFPDNYILDPLVEYELRGRIYTRRLTPTDQIRMCGNSVPPPVAEALVRANYVEQRQEAAA